MILVVSTFKVMNRLYESGGGGGWQEGAVSLSRLFCESASSFCAVASSLASRSRRLHRTRCHSLRRRLRNGQILAQAVTQRLKGRKEGVGGGDVDRKKKKELITKLTFAKYIIYIV